MGRSVLVFALFACAVHAQLVTTCSVSEIPGSHPTSVMTNACQGGTTTFPVAAGQAYTIGIWVTSGRPLASTPTTVCGDTPQLIISENLITPWPSGSSDPLYFYWVPSSVGCSANAVTATATGPTFGIFMTVNVYNNFSTGSLDTYAVGNGGSGFGQTISTAPFTTTSSNDTVTGFCAVDNPSLPVAGPGYTLNVNGADPNSFIWSQQTTLAVPTTGAVFSMKDQNNWACIAAAFKAQNVPAVVTAPPSSITSSSAAAVNNTVTNAGGSAITAEGVCYSTAALPTTPCTSDGTTSPWTSSMTGLASFTTYHYRAYATNSSGTGYGPEVLVFTTPYPATLGSDIKLSVTGSTSTQIQIQYTPLTSAACLIFGLDLNGGGDILDLDTNYYTSANSDLYRTTAHGYPWPVMTNGNQRNLILGWHDFVSQDSSGKWHSRALQAASPINIQVVCDGGANIRSVVGATQTVRAGSNYAEMPIPVIGAPLGNWPVPTINWDPTPSVRASNVNIDPTTGIIYQPLTYGSDSFNGGPVTGLPAPYRRSLTLSILTAAGRIRRTSLPAKRAAR